jgi:hypothetical protein
MEFMGALQQRGKAAKDSTTPRDPPLLWITRAPTRPNAVPHKPLSVATCNRKPANLQSCVFFDRHYLQLKGVQTGIICN